MAYEAYQVFDALKRERQSIEWMELREAERVKEAAAAIESQKAKAKAAEQAAIDVMRHNGITRCSFDRDFLTLELVPYTDRWRIRFDAIPEVARAYDLTLPGPGPAGVDACKHEPTF